MREVGPFPMACHVYTSIFRRYPYRHHRWNSNNHTINTSYLILSIVNCIKYLYSLCECLTWSICAGQSEELVVGVWSCLSPQRDHQIPPIVEHTTWAWHDSQYIRRASDFSEFGGWNRIHKLLYKTRVKNNLNKKKRYLCLVTNPINSAV